MDLDIEAYARVMAELSAGPARAEVLARRHLDEERWNATDAYWQERLSEAFDEVEGRRAPARRGVCRGVLADYVRGSQHWSGRMAEDPQIERRFEEALRGS